ncbi:hypothetical protein, partial [Cupriavidus sp. UBA2526]|uniref:hypothetical protein n=1 Tax=Cupriavidus sp. UBA2526 TaxID=1946398 RepID=UPI00257BD077
RREGAIVKQNGAACRARPGVDEKAGRRTIDTSLTHHRRPHRPMIGAHSAHGRAMVVDPTIPSHPYCAQGYRRTMRRPMLKLCDARVPYP